MFYIGFFMSDSLIPSFLVSNVSEWLRAHQKLANEQIARFFERIAHLSIFFAKKGDSLRKPMSEFPALQILSQKMTDLTVEP